jgi:hypothetical protein
MNRAAVAILLLTAIPASAQDDADVTPAERFSIHGYLTQAFAKTDGKQVIGIPGNGTTDYRRAALLVRMNPTTKDSLVIQLANRKLGESPSIKLEPDVKVDWAFYERKIGDSFSFRAGRAPLPFGLLNETRYVGTLLPFYRTPFAFYREGRFTSETIDGMSVRYATRSASSWGFEMSVYAGGISMIEVSNANNTTTVSQARAENTIGGQAWLTTPIEGLRFGLGAQRFELRKTVLIASGKDFWQNVYPSAEYVGSRVKLRSEFQRRTVRDLRAIYKAFYVYAGVNVTDRLAVHGQFDTSSLELKSLPAKWNDYDRDRAVGTSFAVRPDVVFKGEFHWLDTRNVEVPFIAPSLPATRVKYGILSMSVSF